MTSLAINSVLRLLFQNFWNKSRKTLFMARDGQVQPYLDEFVIFSSFYFYPSTGLSMEFDKIHLKDAIVTWSDMHSFSEFDKFEPMSNY